MAQHKKSKKLNTRKLHSSRRQSPFISFIIFAFVVVVFVGSVRLYTDLRRESKQLEIEQRDLEAKVEQEQIRLANLQAEAEYMQTNAYIEDYARNKLGLVYPDEIVIRPQ